MQRLLSVNVRSVVMGIQAAARPMSEGGRIITIGSVVAQRTSFPGSSIYTMTKSAVAGLVRGLSPDLAARGITVNKCSAGRELPTECQIRPRSSPGAGASSRERGRSGPALQSGQGSQPELSVGR